jgi:plasmid stabilization system protein ParE
MALFLTDRALQELEDVLWWYEDSAGRPVAAAMDARFRAAFEKIGEGILPGSPRTEWLPDRYRFSLMAP